jgi:hypothetical protein
MKALVAKYGGPTALLNILTDFYQRINNSHGLRHYFFNVPLKQVVADQFELMPYVLRKTAQDYRGPIQQTAIREIRVRLHVFEDVIKVLHLVLRHAKVHYLDAPLMASHIIEMIEETRSRFADMKRSVYKSGDIKPQVLLGFFQTQGIASHYDEQMNEIFSKHGAGLAYPLFTAIDAPNKAIHLMARVQAHENADPREIEQIIQAASAKVPQIQFYSYEDEDENEEMQMMVEGRYTVPTQYDVPIRLLQRVTHQFTWRFEDAMKVDTRELLAIPALMA